MAAADFQVRNGIIANTYVIVGVGSTNVTINTTSFSGTANNALYLNGAPASAVVNTSGNFTFTGNITSNGVSTYNANVTFAGGTVSIQANTLNQTLTDGSTISWDVSQGQIATVTLGGNRTMNAPTNLKVSTYLLHVIQDSTGSRTLTWNSVFKWPAGVAPPLTTTAGARDVFSFVSDGTNLYGSFLPNVK
jgi:hypothetical protein